MLFIISGAAACGKSSSIELLKGKIENLECHDDCEKPAKTGTERRELNEEWIKLALEAQAEGRDFLIAGQAPYGEYLACPSAIKLNGIRGCLLDCHDSVRVERYLARPQFKEWPLGMDTLCWAVFHRMHAMDPQWEQRVIVDKELSEWDWSRWSNWQKDDLRWDLKVIDTTNNKQEETAEIVRDWVAEERMKSQPLTPERKWWI